MDSCSFFSNINTACLTMSSIHLVCDLPLDLLPSQWRHFPISEFQGLSFIRSLCPANFHVSDENQQRWFYGFYPNLPLLRPKFALRMLLICNNQIVSLLRGTFCFFRTLDSSPCYFGFPIILNRWTWRKYILFYIHASVLFGLHLRLLCVVRPS